MTHTHIWVAFTEGGREGKHARYWTIRRQSGIMWNNIYTRKISIRVKGPMLFPPHLTPLHELCSYMR
jgi:hypothetical protein